MPEKRSPPAPRQRGFSYIELLVAVSVLAILATAVIPLATWDQKRRDEARMKIMLQTMRDAIDQYHKYAEEGQIIMSDVEQMNFPLTLDELVDGVDIGDPRSPESTTIRFLQKIPVDPFTGEAVWGMRSYQDDFDSKSWGRENVYDVYSLSNMRALDETYYSDW